LPAQSKTKSDLPQLQGDGSGTTSPAPKSDAFRTGSNLWTDISRQRETKSRAVFIRAGMEVR
ncbi:MAG: hypothetical protein ACK4MY_04565, partial [Brevundimonas sp.]